MGDEAFGNGTCQFGHLGVHATEPDRWGHHVARFGPKVVLETGERDVLAANIKRCSRGEARPTRSDGGDVLSHGGDGVRPGHGESLFDVLANLAAETELEASTRERREIPRGQCGEHGAPDERQRHRSSHRQGGGVLEGEERDRQRIVHGFSDVEPVVAERFDALGGSADFGEGEARIHSGVDLHENRPSATMWSRS